MDSLDSGWSSGKIALKSGAITDLPLAKTGDNTFKIFVFDPDGGPIGLKQDRIVIARTAATVDAIPASHTIAIEVRDRVGSDTVLDILVREGEPLPKRGQRKYLAGDTIRAGSSESLKFSLWEGDIEYPVSGNRFIGLYKISGNDFTDGVIAAGAEIVCDYEVLDSGNIILEVTIPSIRGSFQTGWNFYSRKEGEIDYTKAAKLVRADAESVESQLADMAQRVADPLLQEARNKLARAEDLSPSETHPETTKQAMDDVQRAKELLAKARKANFRSFRRAELDSVKAEFEHLRQHAKPAEQDSFDALVRTAERDLPNPAPNFEAHLEHLQAKVSSVLLRQDWFIIDGFNWYAENPHLFSDRALHDKLEAEGKAAIARQDIDALRQVLQRMSGNRISTPKPDEFLARANIVRVSA